MSKPWFSPRQSSMCGWYLLSWSAEVSLTLAALNDSDFHMDELFLNNFFQSTGHKQSFYLLYIRWLLLFFQFSLFRLFFKLFFLFFLLLFLLNCFITITTKNCQVIVPFRSPLIFYLKKCRRKFHCQCRNKQQYFCSSGSVCYSNVL